VEMWCAALLLINYLGRKMISMEYFYILVV